MGIFSSFKRQPSIFPLYLVISILVSCLALAGCSTSPTPRVQSVDSIHVEQPKPGQVIESPLTVTGAARGSWYFEGDFTVKLLTSDGRQLGTGILSAQSNWMSTDSVRFEGQVTFDRTGVVKRGRLLFESANPSGRPEHQKSAIVPVRFQTVQGVVTIQPYSERKRERTEKRKERAFIFNEFSSLTANKISKILDNS